MLDDGFARILFEGEFVVDHSKGFVSGAAALSSGATKDDPGTLLQTPRTCVSKFLKRGKYVHLGLERGLLDELRLCPLTGIPEVHVQLHVDGMKVFKASAECLWPILARVNHPVVGQPFVVGVFCGFGKPEPLEDFLGDCFSELKGLLTTGLRDPRTENVIKVNLLNVICDTPARCYVRQVKAHNGYYGCDRHIRKLSSDSDDEDSPNQPTEPTGWPAPPPILQRSTTISSYVSTAKIPTEFSQQVQKDMADIKGQLVNTNVRLAALEKRNDFLAEQLMALHSSVQQMQATLSDVVNALQRASSAGSVTSSSLNLPLCTEEAYENFLRRLSVEDGFANEAVCAHLLDCFQIRQLAMVGGRNEAGFLRNLLTVLLGPPLCHNFCWAGGSKEKKSFMTCPLFSVLKVTSVAKTMELTYFSFGLVTALGLQLTYTAAFMAVVSTFKDSKYFGIACGIMVSGGGIGAFATNHMVAWILSLWTLREALIIQAAVLLHAWFSAALFYWVDETAILEEQLRESITKPDTIDSSVKSEPKAISHEPSPNFVSGLDDADLEQQGDTRRRCLFRDLARLWFLCPILMILTPASHRPRVQKTTNYKDTRTNMAEEEDCASKSRTLLRNIGDGLVQLFSRKLWTNWGFLLFIACNGLCAAGVVIPWTFIYDYIYQIWLVGVPPDSVNSQVDAQLAWYPSLIGLGSCCGQVVVGIIASNIKKESSKANTSIHSGDVGVVVAEASHNTCYRWFRSLSSIRLLFASICLFNGVVTIGFAYAPIPSALDIGSEDLLILGTAQGRVLAFASFMLGVSDGGFMTMLGLMLENEVETQYFPAALGICLCVTGAFNFVGTVVGGEYFSELTTSFLVFLLECLLHIL
ncbi:hypothetical protein SprV_0301279100 [Sparganum proliferum]